MSRIKVTAYIDPASVAEDGHDDLLDLSHEMGVSNKGYENQARLLGYAEDVEFELVDE